MKHFAKILCPFDFSEYAEDALQYAIKLAERDSVVCLINAVQLPYLIAPDGFAYYDMNADEIKKIAETALDKKVKDLATSNAIIKFEYILEFNEDPAKMILDHQLAKNYDLIVMGSHGRTGFGRLLMGSVAESVMRASACPVLIIKTNKLV